MLLQRAVFCTQNNRKKRRVRFELKLGPTPTLVLWCGISKSCQRPSSTRVKNAECWAKFHRAAKHTNLLSVNFLPMIKTGLPTKFHVTLRISKQQLNTSNKQYATNINLVGNPVFIKEELISC